MDYGCLQTEPPLNPIENKKKMGEIFFESFKVPRF
jgi:actin-related protein